MNQSEQRSIEELCAPGHAQHMATIKQDEWLKNTLASADKRKMADEEQLAADVDAFRKTGRWPARKAPKKGRHS